MLKYRIDYVQGATGEQKMHKGEINLFTYVKTGKYISEDLCDTAYTMADKGYYEIYLWRPTKAAWEKVANSYTDFDKPRRKWL